MSAKRVAIAIGCLTVALGATVVVSWLGFGGRAAATGPVRAIEQSGIWIYGSQAVLAFGVGAVAAILLGGSIRRPAMLALLMFGAWIGEGIFLTLAGSLVVANELDPEIAWFYWLLATAGPMQPLAATLGALGAWALRQRASRASRASRA